MADEKQPLLTEKDKEKDGGSTEYGANGEGDLYYMGVLKSELFDTDHHVGLTTEEAERRVEKFGRNELEEKEDDKWYVLRNFKERSQIIDGSITRVALPLEHNQTFFDVDSRCQHALV